MAVFWMIPCHAFFYLFTEQTHWSSIATFVYAASLLCAPIFLYAYSYVISTARPLHRVARRLLIILAACLAFDFMLHTLTVPPYAHHVLYDFVVVTAIMPLLIRIPSSFYLYIALSIPLVSPVAFIWFDPASLSDSFFSVFFLGTQSTVVTSTASMVHFPVLPFFAFVFLGMYLRSSTPASAFMPVLKGSSMLVVALALASGHLNDDSVYIACRVYVLMVLVVGVHWLAMLDWPVVFDRVLLPFGRHILPIYFIHHIPVFLLALILGGHIQYGLMASQEHLTFIAGDWECIILTITLWILAYGIARSFDTYHMHRRIRLYTARSGVHLS